MKSYYPLLDVVRFFAAFWVMSFHYFLGFSGELSWYRYGNLGVPLFFIISGFVISQSVAHSTLRSFAVGRFIRLFPLFWIICTCTYIFTLLMPNGTPVQFPEYIISMTMLGEHLANAFGYIHIVDAAYWSLVVELLFYVAIGLFVYLFSWKNIRWFTGLWLLISALAFFFHVDDSFIAKMLLVRHASYFLFGITLMLVVSTDYKTILQKYYDYAFLIGVAVYGACISPYALPPYLTPHPHDTLIVLLLQAVFFISVAALVYLSSSMKSEKVIRRMAILGGLTYPLYLVHQTVGTTIIDYFKGYGTLAVRGSMIMLVMIGIAYIAYIYDKKLRHKLTRILLPAK